jgi:hypothetical protein
MAQLTNWRRTLRRQLPHPPLATMEGADEMYEETFEQEDAPVDGAEGGGDGAGLSAEVRAAARAGGVGVRREPAVSVAIWQPLEPSPQPPA